MLLSFLLSIADESDHDKIVYLVQKFHKTAIAFAKNRLYENGFPDYETKAEDIVSDVYLKLVTNIKQIDFSKSEKDIRSYVLTSVVNAINSTLRKKDPIFESIDDNEEEISEQDFVNGLLIKEQYEKVVEAIKELDEKYRIPLLYLYFFGKSIKETASLMEINEETVYKRVQRGRKKLLEIIGTYEKKEVAK